MMRLFKIKWGIPYASYETYVIAADETEALNSFNLEIKKEVSTYDVESTIEMNTSGVIVTKHIK